MRGTGARGWDLNSGKGIWASEGGALARRMALSSHKENPTPLCQGDRGPGASLGRAGRHGNRAGLSFQNVLTISQDGFALQLIGQVHFGKNKARADQAIGQCEVKQDLILKQMFTSCEVEILLLRVLFLYK